MLEVLKDDINFKREKKETSKEKEARMKINLYENMTTALQRLSSIAIKNGSSSNIGNNGNTGNNGNNNNMSSSGVGGMSVSANNITINCMYNLWESSRNVVSNQKQLEQVNRAVYRFSNELFIHFKRWKDGNLSDQQIISNLITVASTYENISTNAKK